MGRSGGEYVHKQSAVADFQTFSERLLVITVLVVISVVLIPITVAFQEELDEQNLIGFNLMERGIDVLFMMHVVLNFRTAIIIEQDLITNSRTIIWHYCKGWFVMDIVASFPFDILMSNQSTAGSKASGGFRLARLLRLGRLVRVASFARMRMSSNGMRLLKLVFYLITIA